MHTIALFGAGKIGEAIAALFALSGRYTVRVCDPHKSAADRIAAVWGKNIEACGLDLADRSATLATLKGCDLVLSALPFFCNRQVAEYAGTAGVHYVDLTEDVAVSDYIRKLASKASTCFMPQCGLAPGFISIVAHHLISLFDTVESVKMRVGALPVFPTNRLKYSLTWSTDGLINEYCNPCEAIHDGHATTVAPLEGYEQFSLDGDEYEAFNTSGGLGSLCTSMISQVRELNYKSIRYPGHRELMMFLLEDLQFKDDRTTLRSVLERSLPTTFQDKCVILVEAVGSIGKRTEQKTYASTVYNQQIGGKHFSAIQVTTAAGVCAVVDLLLGKQLGLTAGFVRSEDVPLPLFLQNEFGKYYFDPTTTQMVSGVSP